MAKATLKSKPKPESSFQKRYDALNSEQKRAVDAIDGPVMVVAGPGSGKTEILGLRVANIIKNRDVQARNILCLTFTDAAAANMRERLLGLLGAEAYKVAIHTFHSFGVEIINRYPERFYGGAAFMAADEVTQIEILQDIFTQLGHDDPLRTLFEGKFIYLQKTLRAIEQLKKAGLTPEDFSMIIEKNSKAAEHIDALLAGIFNQTISRKLFAPAAEAAARIAELPTEPLPGGFIPLPVYYATSLAEAVEAAQLDGTPILTAWKAKHIKKGDGGTWHTVETENQKIFESLARIYAEYEKRMLKEGYYDYNDMILQAKEALRTFDGMRSELQERYQYVLVDEFQDTNNAQMELLRLISDHPVHEGRPNVMVVGDDDQAIFKFQGAEIDNILNFKKIYKDPEIIVLQKNYRSDQSIIDAARHVIKQGTRRLETMLPNFTKELQAARKDLRAEISGKEFFSREAQYQWIASEAKRLIGQGIVAKEIAVIARRHAELRSMVPYFHANHTDIAYEWEENVLQSPHIKQLIVMARFVSQLLTFQEQADALLPEILSYPFWQIPRADLWKLSLEAKRQPWIEAMQHSGKNMQAIANFFLDLAARATHETAEEILHELVGGPQLFSPFRSFYFGADRFHGDRSSYLQFLSSLQSFIRTLREYRPGKALSLADLIAFVDMHEANELSINNINQFSNGKDAVQFMTAHKAKGLEFEVVFIVNCEEQSWTGSKSGFNLKLPSNLPIGPAGDERDDQLRLFYVAMTRAKRVLCFTASQRDHRGKQSMRLGFLAPGEDGNLWLPSEMVDMGETEVSQEQLLESQWDAPKIFSVAPDEKALLQPALERYQLSVTHLQNFLNVADAGPVTFLERNLLMFPEPKTVDGSFGTAIHATIRQIFTQWKLSGQPPEELTIQSWFESYLKAERLNPVDFKRKLTHGKKMLQAWWEEKKSSLQEHDVIEFNFRDQGVVMGNAKLTGKVDRMIMKDGIVTVCDFKTGKAISRWDPADPYEKVKAWKYRQQLIFYKLLIEHSRDYSTMKVREGFIQFLEAQQGKIIDISLEIAPEDADRLERLIEVVHGKIQSLDFPDITKYPKDIKGILQFEEDLLNGTV